MLRTANCFIPVGRGMTDGELITLSQRNDVVLSCGDGTIPHRFGRKAFGYCQPTHQDNSWTMWLEDFGYRKWLDQQHLDGFLIDTPFEGSAAGNVGRVAQAIFPLPYCVNFGDVHAWAMKSTPEINLVSKVLQFAPWHFVQNAYDISQHTEARWRDLKAAALPRLSAGKTLVLGLYDPQIKGLLQFPEERTMLAALLSQSFEHSNLYWHYYTDATCASGVDDQWNPYWSLAI